MTIFIDTNGDMDFTDNERLRFVMHFLRLGSDPDLLEIKNDRFVREDAETSFQEIWLPCATAKQKEIDDLKAELEKSKAQAVPNEIINEIQSWIAVHSIQAMELDGESFVVGANELADYIHQLSTSVTDGYVVVPVELYNFQANRLAEEDFKQNKVLFESEHRGLSGTEVELRKLKWLECRAESIKENYRRLVKWASESGAEG